MRATHLLACVAATLSLGAQAAEYMPAKGSYVDSLGTCIDVQERDKTAREFTLSTGDICKPGLDGPVGVGAEERTFRCVAKLSGGTYGFWGTLKRGGAAFTVIGDTQFTMETDGTPRTQQQLMLSTPLAYVPDTEGKCTLMKQGTTSRPR